MAGSNLTSGRGKRSQINARLENHDTREAARAEILAHLATHTTVETAAHFGISVRQLVRIRKRYDVYAEDLRRTKEATK